MNEPGVNKQHRDFVKYTKIIEYKNIDVGILAMITKKSGVYSEVFDMFYPIMKETFLKNAPEILSNLERKNNAKEILSTDLYSMKVYTNYEILSNNFKEVYQEIQEKGTSPVC